MIGEPSVLPSADGGKHGDQIELLSSLQAACSSNDKTVGKEKTEVKKHTYTHALCAHVHTHIHIHTHTHTHTHSTCTHNTIT